MTPVNLFLIAMILLMLGLIILSEFCLLFLQLMCIGVLIVDYTKDVLIPVRDIVKRCTPSLLEISLISQLSTKQ